MVGVHSQVSTPQPSDQLERDSGRMAQGNVGRTSDLGVPHGDTEPGTPEGAECCPTPCAGVTRGGTERDHNGNGGLPI